MSEPDVVRKTRVFVAGGGVAALEASLALRALAGDQTEVSLLTRSREFVMRPMTVQEPFAFASATRTAIAPIVEQNGIEQVHDELAAVDPAAKTLTTTGGQTFEYDALIVACGARPTVRYEHAVTIDDRKLDDLLHGMIQDIEGDYIHSLAFVAGPRMAWPLPLYELALMTAHRAWDMGISLQTTIITPEDRVLSAFGSTVSAGVTALLRERGINVITSAHAEIPQRRHIVINPGDRRLQVDRVIALPELFGPAIQGLPQDDLGFLPIDDHCKVVGVDGVYAAGDATDFPIKHGGLAAQMGVTAARAIAAHAGAPVSATPLDPVLRGMLLTGRAPRYLYAHRVGGHAFDSEFTETPTWQPPIKISVQYLAPYLDGSERRAPAAA